MTDLSGSTSPREPARRYRRYIFQGYLLIALVAFAVLFVYARTVPYFSFDLPIARAIQTLPDALVGSFMVGLTWIGWSPQSYVWCGAVLIFLWLARLRWEAVMTLFAALGVTILGQFIKGIVQRARPTPDLFRVAGQVSESSFPSGHVLLFVAFFGFLMFLLYTLAPRSWWRTLGLVLMGAAIVLIGISRVYLGQHFPSDVLGAYLLGSLWLALTIYVYRWGKERKFLVRGSTQ